MNKAESFLNNPDKYLPPVITTEQILETYGALFQPIYIDTEDYFIEEKMKTLKIFGDSSLLLLVLLLSPLLEKIQFGI